MDHLKRNWKKYALTGAAAAGAYYGIPPETAQSALTTLLSVFGL